MDVVLTVVEIVALAAIAALAIYLITVLVRVRSLLTTIERDIREISTRAIPIMENVEVITDKVKSVAEAIDEHVDTVKGAVDSIRGIADRIVDFERRVQDRIDEPVMETVGTIAAVVKGVRMFFTRLRAS